ncbi:Sulfotransferase (fragment) [Sterolibacterium denitrificans]|uniref:Sulfotransferase n=1 Tax=Sterolibacterium denitrificans TaxID=157592 RepID=A0A7Z7MVR2_9PROT
MSAATPQPAATTDRRVSLPEAFALALRYQRENRLAEAEALLRRILHAAPRHAPALHLLGVVLHQGGRTDLAAELLRQAVDAAPDEALYRANLCEMYRLLRRLDEAVAQGERAAALAPDLALAHSNLGIACYDQGALAQARAHQERALALDPQLPAALNNLGSILRDQKDRPGAIARYRQVLALQPGHAEACNNLASVLTESEQPEAAIQLLLPLLQRLPDYAEAHCNLGTAFLALERFDKAAHGFRRALALKPDHAEACLGLAQVQQELGALDEAQAMAERALTLAPPKKCPPAHVLLGRIYNEAGYPERSRQAFTQALALDPTLPSAYLGRGHLSMELGDLQGAEADFRRALHLSEETPLGLLGARLALAQVDKVREGDENMAALVAEGAKIDELPELKALPLHFALGKCYEDTKQYDLAFHHYQAGCRLKRQRIDYSAERTESIGDAIRGFFSKENIDRLRGEGCASNLPIFVLGMPRSGTTLTETILASHPLVHGAGELHDIIRIAGNPCDSPNPPDDEPQAAGYPLNLQDITPAALQQMGRRYIAGLQARAPAAARITDKMPANFNYLGLIHLMLPQAKIVHVKRNPVDTCLSCYTRLFGRSQYQSYDLAELGRYYRNYARLMQHWREVLPPGAFHEIQYEALVADQEGQARALLDYCELPWDAACMDFHKTERSVRTASVTQVRQPIYQTSVEKWRHYEKHLGPLLEALGDLVPASYS